MKRRALADELADENQAIFYNMNTGCASVLKGKHLALLEKDGFKLTGLQHPSGILLLMWNRDHLQKKILWNNLSSYSLRCGAKFNGPRAEYDQDL